MTIQEYKDKIRSFVKEDVLSDETTWSSIEKDLDAVISDNISGVLQNKEKILGEKKKLEAEFKALKESAGPLIEKGITLDQFAKLQTELEEARSKAGGNSDDIKVLQEKFYEQGKRSMEQELSPKLKEFEQKFTGLEKEKSEMFNKYINTLKKNQIIEAVKKLNIQADNYWLAGFSSQSEQEYIETEDRLNLMVPNPVDPSGPRVPLQDWMKLFPTTAEGKKMIVAPVNSGSGSIGSDGKPIIKKDLKDEIGSMFVK